jgi:GNAT superfamily N-acetyltransferase
MADGMLRIMQVRRATRSDIPAAVETISTAFQGDPMWGWAFPDPLQRPAQFRRWWNLYVTSAARYAWTWLADDAAAVATWIPPGGTELTDEEEASIEPLLRELIGPWADTVLQGLHRFDEAHPHDEPHYYLSLLGTRPDRRGEGLGMALLREALAAIDDEGMPAYLESSNPINNRRYERAGFTDIGVIAMPGDGPLVTRMWRAARGRPAG